MTGELPPEVPPQYLLSPVAPAPRTLIDILYDTAGRYPEAPAIDDGEVQLTYAELITDIEDSVRWLAARGIGRGDRIGIRMPSGSYALYVAILATLATGAAYVPVDADDPQERAELMFAQANVVAIITEDRVYKRGAVTLHMLRHQLGDVEFFALPQDWTARYRHSTVATDDFTGLASHYTNESLRPAWDRWLYSTEFPALDPP